MPDNPEQEQFEENLEGSGWSAGEKVGLPEEIFVLLIFAFAWAIELLVALTGVGIIISEAINAALGAGLELYLWLRGAKGLWQLIMPLIGTIAEASVVIPGQIIALLIVFYLMNHPKLAAVASGATKAVSVAKREVQNPQKTSQVSKESVAAQDVVLPENTAEAAA